MHTVAIHLSCFSYIQLVDEYQLGLQAASTDRYIKCDAVVT